MRATYSVMVEHISVGGRCYAVVVRSSFESGGTRFLTPPELSQQLAVMCHPAGHSIKAHFHNPHPRSVQLTQEVLMIRKGRLRVDLFDDDRVYLGSCELNSGDIILLAGGGHGFEVLEDVDMVEVKQGPFAGPEDKTVFPSIESTAVRQVPTQDQWPKP